MLCHPSPTCKVSADLQTPISTCSTEIFTERPTHRRSLLLTTLMTLFKCIVNSCMFHLKLAHLLHIDARRFRIEIVKRCCHERKHLWYCRNVQCPVPGMFCSQNCAHHIYHIHVLQPKGRSPRIFEGLVSEHFLYSALARQASPAIKYPSSTCAKQLLTGNQVSL